MTNDLTTPISEPVRRVADLLIASGAREVYLINAFTNGTPSAESELGFAVAGLSPEIFYRTLGEAMFAANRDLDLVDLDGGGPRVDYLKATGSLRRVA